MNLFIVFINLIESIIFSFFYYPIYSCGKSKKIIICIFLCLFQFGMTTYINQYSVTLGYVAYFACVIYFILLLKYNDDPLLNKVIYAIFPDFLLAVISAGITVLFSFVFYGNINYTSLIQQHLIIVSITTKFIQGIVFYGTAKLIKNNRLYRLTNLQKGIVIIMILSCYTTIISLEHSLFYRQFKTIDLTITITSTILMTIAIMILIKEMYFSNLIVEHLKIEKELLNNEVLNTKGLIESQQELHQIRHDLKHVLDTINGYDKESLSSIYKKYNGKLDDVYIPINSGNETIDIILNAKYIQAKRNDISMKSIVNLPNSYPFEDEDLQVILINLLDNALENIGGDRLISVELVEIANLFVIKMCNTVDGCVIDGNGEFINVSKKEGHGYGIPSIKEILKSYHGVMNYKQEADIVIVTITMPMKSF